MSNVLNVTILSLNNYGVWKVGGRKVANKGPENRGGALSPETKDLFCLRIILGGLKQKRRRVV